MDYAKPLPSHLQESYRGWKSTKFAETSERFRKLADEGQEPHTMVISCCDSRVHPTSLFAADEGELFAHRIIASLVPANDPDGDYPGTAAAVEYGITALKVSNLVVIGHSQCGGVKGCHDMCSGGKKADERSESFVLNWLEILRPGFDRLDPALQGEDALRALEKEAVLLSLENLMTFPFVKDAVDAGRLNLTGLWNDIGSGTLEYYSTDESAFVPV